MTYQSPAINLGEAGSSVQTGWGSAVNDSQNELWNLADDYEDVTTGYTLTGITIGNGTVDIARYRVNANVHVIGRITLGSTSSVTGTVYITATTADAKATGYLYGGGRAAYYDTSGADYHLGGTYDLTSAGDDQTYFHDAAGATVNATTPFTWASGDIIMWSAIMQQNVEFQVIR